MLTARRGQRSFTLDRKMFEGTPFNIVLAATSAFLWLLLFCPVVKAQLLYQDFESVNAPALPADWSSAGSAGFLAGSVTRASSYEGLQALVLPEQPNGVSGSLTTPSISIPPDVQTQVRFFLKCHFGGSPAGAILQIKIGAADFVEFQTAGGSFETGAYSSTPIAALPVIEFHPVWANTRGQEYGQFIAVRALLPSSAAGQAIRLRWLSSSYRYAGSNKSIGCIVDDLAISAISDLSVTHSSAQAEVLAGNELSYRTIVSNLSQRGIENTVVELSLPWWSSLVQADATSGLSSTFDSAGKTLAYTISSLPAGASRTLDTKVLVAVDAQADPYLSLSAPSEVAGDYPLRLAAFGPAVPTRGLLGPIVRPHDGEGQPFDACSLTAGFAPTLENRFSFAQSGGCSVADKARNAQKEKAKALIVYPLFYRTDFRPAEAQTFEFPEEIAIPVLSIRSRDAAPIIQSYSMALNSSGYPSGSIRTANFQLISAATVRANGLIEPSSSNNRAIAFTTFKADPDQDKLFDQQDNCPRSFNPDQKDLDLDGIGDVCDTCTDSDKDGFGNPGYSANTCSADLCVEDPKKSAPQKCGCGMDEYDADRDGVPDCLDACPYDRELVAKGICGCDPVGGDKDQDGTPDCADECPFDPKKSQEAKCGCGIADVDSDGDGSFDCVDGCPLDPTRAAKGVCGCGAELNIDLDNDGLPACIDLCPLDALKSGPGVCGCGVVETDLNSNLVMDCLVGADLKQQLKMLSSEIQSLHLKSLSKTEVKELKARWQGLLKEMQSTINAKASVIAVQNSKSKLAALMKAFSKSMQPVLKLSKQSFSKDRKLALKKLQALEKKLL